MLKPYTVSDSQIYTAIKREQYFNHNILACFFFSRRKCYHDIIFDYFIIFTF